MHWNSIQVRLSEHEHNLIKQAAMELIVSLSGTKKQAVSTVSMSIDDSPRSTASAKPHVDGDKQASHNLPPPHNFCIFVCCM